jgi:hypothetical protein
VLNRADRISDPAVRDRFLEDVALNREILAFASDG